jgi:hypothetical protein
MKQQSDSIKRLISKAEQAQLDDAMAQARTREMSVDAIRNSLRGQIQSKIWWLNTFGQGPRARPAHEVQNTRIALSALVHAYDMALPRRRGAGDADHPR